MLNKNLKTEKIKFTSYDGYKLEGSYLQAKDKTMGALLFVHGIMSSRDELGFHSDMADFMAQKGIASLRFDYRYHGIFEEPLQNLTLSGIVNDINAAFEVLKRKTSEATSNYFVVGTSFGGGLVAYWVDNFKSNEIKKVILNAPVIDYEEDVLGKNGLLSNGMLSEKAVKQLNSKGYVKSSDANFGRGLINELKYMNGISALKNMGSKLWIFHGDNDEDVPLASSQKFKSETTGLTVIPNVGHGFGIEIDEDLDHPETKAIHKKIYRDVWAILQKEI